jgi:hypothetical protein
MLFRKMEEDGCRPDGHNYNLIIQIFLLHKDLSTTTKPIHEMVDRGLTVMMFNKSKYVQGTCYLMFGLWLIKCSSLYFLFKKWKN